MEENQSYLATENVGKLMGKYAVPCIISLLVGALYNIVDQIFIANASYLGSYGNAANTVVFPLTVIALAIAVMIGDGCCAFVSLNLGKGDGEEAAGSESCHPCRWEPKIRHGFYAAWRCHEYHSRSDFYFLFSLGH